MKFVFVSHGISKKGLGEIAKLVGKKPAHTKLLFIYTPAKTYLPNPNWLVESRNELKNYGFRVHDFDIEDAYKEGFDIKREIYSSDIVCVSGGNTFYFLYWAKQTGLKYILEEFLDNGGVYMGESAGVVCQIADLEPIKWLDKPEVAPEIVEKGLQLTDKIVIPHWGNPKYQAQLAKTRDYYLSNGLNVDTLGDGQIMIIDVDETRIIN